MKATSGNHANWGDSGAGRGCYNLKSRCNALVSTLKKTLRVFGVALLVSAACFGSAKATSTKVFVTSGDGRRYEDCFGIENTDDSWRSPGGKSATPPPAFGSISIGVPKGAKINSATFSANSTDGGSDLYCQIYAEATGVL